MGNLNMEISQRYQYEVNDEGDLVTTVFKVPQSLEVGQITPSTGTSVHDEGEVMNQYAPPTVLPESESKSEADSQTRDGNNDDDGFWNSWNPYRTGWIASLVIFLSFIGLFCLNRCYGKKEGKKTLCFVEVSDKRCSWLNRFMIRVVAATWAFSAFLITLMCDLHILFGC